LTTYISRADEHLARGAGIQPEPLWLEVRREKVNAITQIASETLLMSRGFQM
jgi:hypothetical protein